MADRSKKYVSRDSSEFEIDRSRAKGPNLLAGRMERLRGRELPIAASPASDPDKDLIVEIQRLKEEGLIRVEVLEALELLESGKEIEIVQDELFELIGKDAGLARPKVDLVFRLLGLHINLLLRAGAQLSLLGMTVSTLKDALDNIKDNDFSGS